MRFLAVLLPLLLWGCGNEIEVEAPERVETAPPEMDAVSTMAVPVAISLDEVQASLERQTPRTLWQIDERRETCLPPQRVRALGRDIRVSPDVPCRITGQVRRGAMRLEGSGQRLTIRMPVSATVAARDIGGVIERETATASAQIVMNASLSITRHWHLQADLDLDYSWSRRPGIDILGRRIEFAEPVDRELRGIVAGIERDLEREVSRLPLRSSVERAWRQGFTTVSLNAEDPPVWLTVTPQRLGVNGYRTRGRVLTVDMALAAETRSHIGERPDDPSPTALPGRASGVAADGVIVHLPILAEYAQLEPVVRRELQELAERQIDLPRIGPVSVSFGEVQIYGTANGRIAVGVDTEIAAEGGIARRYGRTEGRVWLTGVPFNEEDSAVVSIRDLTVVGDTDRNTVDLLIDLYADERVRAAIETALVEDFGEDYERIVTDAREAVRTLRTDGATLSLDIDEVSHGRILATGEGLYLPVTVRGSGRLSVELE